MKHILLLSLTFLGLTMLSQAAPIVKPEGVFKMVGINDTSELSGIASLGGDLALLAGDELNTAQVIQIDREALTISRISAPKLISGKDELDAEGVAKLGGAYYVTGSHGYAAKKDNYQASRYQFVKVSPNGDVSAPGTLSQMLASDPILAPYYKKSLGSNGINIEGLAAYGGKLYAGMRGPNLEGKGYVISFSPSAALAGSSQHELHSLDLGLGNGIRSLAEVDGGMLVLTGIASPVGNRPAAVLHWNPSTGETSWLATLSKVKGAPEALLVLATTDSMYQVMVFCDGNSKGPYLFNIPR